MKNNEINIKSFDLPKVPNHLPALHLIGSFVGASGSGKTTALVNMLKEYEKYEAFDTVVLISPTGCLDEDTGIRPEQKFELIKIDEEHGDYSDKMLQGIIDRQKARIKEYKDFLKDLELYKKFINGGNLSDDQILKLYHQYNLEKPQPKHGKNRYPTMLIICDDCGGDPRMFKKGGLFERTICRIRHINSSIIVLVQYGKQIPRAIRKQANLSVIFKTQDKDYLNDMWRENSSADLSFDQFLNLFKKLEKRSDFILIDGKEKDENKKYRKNFDEYIKIN